MALSLQLCKLGLGGRPWTDLDNFGPDLVMQDIAKQASFPQPLYLGVGHTRDHLWYYWNEKISAFVSRST